MYVKYVIGGATLGYSVYDREVSATTTGDREATQYGASFAVNENLSVSYGKATVDFGNSDTDQESHWCIDFIYYGINHYSCCK